MSVTDLTIETSRDQHVTFEHWFMRTMGFHAWWHPGNGEYTSYAVQQSWMNWRRREGYFDDEQDCTC